MLVDCLATELVVVGEDFHFGRRRSGNVALLRELGQRDGFEVAAGAARRRAPTASTSRSAPPPSAGRSPVARSSSPPTMLGRPVRGARHRGARRPARAAARLPDRQRRGAQHDAACPPTACTPGGTSGPNGDVHPCAINLGRRPTFYEHADHSLLEAHLLDFDGDLYGERAEVGSPTSCAASASSTASTRCITQLKHDVEHARAVLSLDLTVV